VSSRGVSHDERRRSRLSPSGWRALLGNVLLALASTLLFCAVLEGACRLAGYETRGSWSARPYERVPGIGHVFIPGFRGTMTKGVASGGRAIAVRINHAGLRGPAIPAAKPAGVRRILILGDSFAFGYLLPEPETFPARLQALVDGRYGRGRVRVLNAGVPGYGIVNERAYLEQRGLALDPDLVVVEASPGDIADAAAKLPPDDDGETLRDELLLYRAVRSSAALTAFQHAFFVVLRAFDPKLPLHTGLHADPPSPELQRARDSYAGEFARLMDVARTHSLPVLALAIPGQIELFSDNDRVQRRRAALAREHGAFFVDVLPALKARRGAGLHLPADGPMNAEGDRIVAQEVDAWLAAHAAEAGLEPVSRRDS
jgi:lysophospholipase L1-like esterase